MSVRDNLYIAVAKFGLLGAIQMGLFDSQAGGGVSSVNNKSADVNGNVNLTTDDIQEGVVSRYLTPEESDKILNLSGINTGDQDLSGLVPKSLTINGITLESNVTLNKSHIGLSNVDNTSDLEKPISTATQSALNAKENSLGSGTTSQYLRGDKTFQTLNAAAVGLSNVNNTSDANKPVSTATQTALNLKVDKDYNPTSNHAGTDIVKPNSTVFVVNPTSASQGIFFANFGQTVWTSSQNLTGGGHTCGAMGWAVHNSTATQAMSLGIEGRIDTQAAGTITQAKAVLGLLSNNAGTMTNAKGVSSEIQNSTGRTITNGYGYYADVPANGGTISKYVAFGMPNMQGVIAGITSKYFIENLDTAAPILTKSPTLQQDYGYSAPTTGQTAQIPNNISDWTFLPAGTLAALTVSLPTAPQDGLTLTVSTTQTITALTVNATSGTVYNPPTTLSAGQTFEYKFIGNGINIWIRKR